MRAQRAPTRTFLKHSELGCRAHRPQSRRGGSAGGRRDGLCLGAATTTSLPEGRRDGLCLGGRRRISGYRSNRIGRRDRQFENRPNQTKHLPAKRPVAINALDNGWLRAGKRAQALRSQYHRRLRGPNRPMEEPNTAEHHNVARDPADRIVQKRTTLHNAICGCDIPDGIPKEEQQCNADCGLRSCGPDRPTEESQLLPSAARVPSDGRAAALAKRGARRPMEEPQLLPSAAHAPSDGRAAALSVGGARNRGSGERCSAGAVFTRGPEI